MKMVKKLTATAVIVALLSTSFVLPESSQAAAKKYVKKLTVSKSSLLLTAGQSASVTAKVTVSGKASTKVTAKSSNNSIATVSVKSGKSGKSTLNIVTKSKGNVTVTVKTKAKNKKKKVISKKIMVYVTNASGTNNGNGNNTPTARPNTPTAKPGVLPTARPDVSPTDTPYIETNVPATNIILDKDSVDLKVGETTTLIAEIWPKNSTDTITWSSSDETIATVSNGVVTTADKEGVAVITVKAGLYQDQCNIRVYKPYSADDFKVEKLANKTVHIDFTAKDTDTANLYKDVEGYTVEGMHVTADVPCESYRYTFYKLPTTLEDIKQIPLNNPCAPMAASICAIHSVDTDMPSSTFASVAGNTLLPMLNYIGGPACNLLDPAKTSPLLHAQFLADRMFKGRGGAPYIRDCYFEGATPNNGYTPTLPYTITMYIGPYYISQKTMLDGTTRPETYMSLIEFAGDDSARYIDVYKSSNGNWYALNSSPYETFKQIIAKPKDIISQPEW